MVFPDYKYVFLPNHTFNEEIIYKINQTINSLDVIQIQAFKSTANNNYKLGYSNLTKDSPY